MIEVIGRTLRLVFGHERHQRTIAESAPPLPEQGPEIEFSAYTEDSRLFGHLRLDGERLTHMLNAFDQFVLVDLMVESLTRETAFELASMAVGRDELSAIEATGPRGNAERRVRVRPFPIGVKLGPYLVPGYVHVSPDADPLTAIRRRAPIVPLTDATIEYTCGETPSPAPNFNDPVPPPPGRLDCADCRRGNRISGHSHFRDPGAAYEGLHVRDPARSILGGHAPVTPTDPVSTPSGVVPRSEHAGDRR